MREQLTESCWDGFLPLVPLLQGAGQERIQGQVCRLSGRWSRSDSSSKEQ